MHVREWQCPGPSRWQPPHLPSWSCLGSHYIKEKQSLSWIVQAKPGWVVDPEVSSHWEAKLLIDKPKNVPATNTSCVSDIRRQSRAIAFRAA